MSLLVPGALGLASLALPLIGLYMLRSRRRRVTVPSVLLWERLDIPVSSAVPWQKLKMTPLLALQLGVLALVVLALARPFVLVPSLLGPHTVIIVDTSGSMAMSNRFADAVEQARFITRDVSEANQVSIVEAGPIPRVAAAFVTSTEEVEQALDGLAVGGGAADLDAAVRLARGLATPDRPTNLVVLSDGGNEELAAEPLVGADHLGFVARGDNLSVETLSVETVGGVQRLFLSVANHTPIERTATVEVVVDGAVFDRLQVPVEAASSTARRLPLDAPPGAVISARLVGPADALPLDDQAWTVVPEGADRKVEVVGEGSPFLAGLVDAVPGFARADGDGDVLVVDRGPLPDLDRPAWVIRTETPPPGITVRAIARNLAVTYQRPGEPILDAVDLSDVAVGEAQVVDAPDWLPLVRSGDVPLILLGDVDGRRVVYTTFDLVHSNLPVQVAFPILGANLLEWLAGADAGPVSSLPAGTPIALPTVADAVPVVTDPAGVDHRLTPDAALYAATSQPGIYRVRYVRDDGTVEPGPVAVRNFDPVESRAGFRTIATTDGTLTGTDTTAKVREWAPWVIALSLGLMAAEWWVGHQRPWRRRTKEAAA